MDQICSTRLAGRLRRSKVLLKLRIQLHVVGIIQEKIELYVDVSRTRQQGGVKGVALRFNQSWIWDSDRVFMAYSFEVQNSADGIPILHCGFTPITSNRLPRVAETFFIRIAILRHDRGHLLGTLHRHA